MRQIIILIIAFLISGCYTQLRTVDRGSTNTDEELSVYQSNEESEESDEGYAEEVNVYHHYYPASDAYFDYLYYNDPFWYDRTRFYLGYPYWSRPYWHRPWWSWCYYCIDHYSPWYSGYYPYYGYPWGGYYNYPYYSSVNYGKRTFSRRGSATGLSSNVSRIRTEPSATTSSAVSKRTAPGNPDSKSRTSVTDKQRKKNSAVKSRSKDSPSKNRGTKVTKRRSGSDSSGSRSRSGNSGRSYRPASPPKSSSSTGSRSGSSNRSGSDSNRSSGKRR